MPSFTASTQNAQHLPSFNLVHCSDHHKSILPNLSYPSRSLAHVPWSGSSAPLLFTKTTRPEMTLATTLNAQVPNANLCFDAVSVQEGFHGISVLIWQNLAMILKLVKSRLFGVRACPSDTASI